MAVPDRDTARKLLADARLPDGIIVAATSVCVATPAAAGLVAGAAGVSAAFWLLGGLLGLAALAPVIAALVAEGAAVCRP